MKEQIDAMIKTVCCDYQIKCNTCGGKYYCEVVDICNDLYNAGYRKQIEGEWGEDGRCSRCEWYMPFDCEGNGIETLFCPHCGAKMKRGDNE